MDIFIINLKQDTERRAHLIKICDSINLNYNFINAIYGKNLLNIDTYTNKNKKRSIKKIGRKLTAGEIGCILSHQFIYKNIINKNISHALILEDDIDILPAISDVLISIKNLTIKWDVILIGYHSTKSREELRLNGVTIKEIYSNYQIKKINESAHGTYGYVVSLNGAKKILQQSSEFDVPIDHYTGNIELNTIYAIYPQLVSINKKLSDQSLLTQERIELINAIKVKKLESHFRILNKKISLFSGKFTIYGFNDLAILVLNHYKDRVSTIIDKNKAGQTFEDITIQSIDNLVKNNDVIVITAINSKFINEIKVAIKKVNLKAKIISLNDVFG